MKICGKALGVPCWMESLRKSLGQNPDLGTYQGTPFTMIHPRLFHILSHWIHSRRGSSVQAAIKQETCCRSAELRQASQILRNVASWSAKCLNVGFEFIYFMKGRTIHQTFGIGLLLLVGRKKITSLISSGPGRWETWERSLIKSMRTAEARYSWWSLYSRDSIFIQILFAEFVDWALAKDLDIEDDKEPEEDWEEEQPSNPVFSV